MELEQHTKLDGLDDDFLVGSMTIGFSVLGIMFVYFQCRQLTRWMREVQQKYRGGDDDEDNNIMTMTTTSKDIKTAQQEIRGKHRQSYKAIVVELESMRQLQQDIKAKLVELQSIVDMAKEKQRSNASSGGGTSTPEHANAE